MSIRQRLRIVTFIVFAAVTLWIGWALVDDLHAAAVAYDRSPLIPPEPALKFSERTVWDLAFPHHSDSAWQAYRDHKLGAWENAAKRQTAAVVAFAIALILLPRRAGRNAGSAGPA